MKILLINRAQSLLATVIFILLSFIGIFEIAGSLLANVQNTEVLAAAEDDCKEKTETEFFFSHKTTFTKKTQPTTRRKKILPFFAPKLQTAQAVILKTSRTIAYRSLLI